MANPVVPGDKGVGLTSLGSRGGGEAEGPCGEWLQSEFVDLWVSPAVRDDTWRVWLTRLTDAPV